MNKVEAIKKLNKIKLMFNYELGKTLNENVSEISNTLTENVDELDEQKIGRIAGEEVANLRKAFQTGFSKTGKAVEIKAADGALVKTSNVDDIMSALKDGRITSKTLGELNIVLLSSKDTPKNVLNVIINNPEFDKQFLSQFGKLINDERALMAQLEKTYPKKTAQMMINRVKGGGKKPGKVKPTSNVKQKSGDNGINVSNTGSGTINLNVTTTQAVQNTEKALANAKAAGSETTEVIGTVLQNQKEIRPTIYDKIKKVGGKLNKKWLLGLGLLGAAGYASYKMFGDTKDADYHSTVPKCIQELGDREFAEFSHTSSGDPVLVLTTTGVEEYDDLGGLNFYMNGRVIARNNSKRGSWTCKNNEIVTQGVVNEQASNELYNDVEKMIDLLDFPVSYANMVSAEQMLKKYMGRPDRQKFLQLYQQSGLGGGDLKKSISFIYTTSAKSTDLKNNLLRMVDKMESGGGQSSLNDLINIVWDGEKKDSTPVQTDKPKTKPKKQVYVECNDFPFNFGCKSDYIRKIQRCLGMPSKYQTGNFGPITKSKLGAEIITKEMYDTITSNCSGNLEKSKVNITPNTDSTSNSTVGPDKIDASYADKIQQSDETRMTPEKLYNQLRENGTIYGSEGGSRIKYKGPEPSAEVFNILDSFLNSKGYSRIKQKDKDDEVKYVWEKQ